MTTVCLALVTCRSESTPREVCSTLMAQLEEAGIGSEDYSACLERLNRVRADSPENHACASACAARYERAAPLSVCLKACGDPDLSALSIQAAITEDKTAPGRVTIEVKAPVGARAQIAIVRHDSPDDPRRVSKTVSAGYEGHASATFDQLGLGRHRAMIGLDVDGVLGFGEASFSLNSPTLLLQGTSRRASIGQTTCTLSLVPLGQGEPVDGGATVTIGREGFDAPVLFEANGVEALRLQGRRIPFVEGRAEAVLDLARALASMDVDKLRAPDPTIALPIALDTDLGAYRGSLRCDARALIAQLAAGDRGVSLPGDDRRGGAPMTLVFEGGAIKDVLGGGGPVRGLDYVARIRPRVALAEPCVYTLPTRKRWEKPRTRSVPRRLHHWQLEIHDRRTGERLMETRIEAPVPKCPAGLPQRREAIDGRRTDAEVSVLIRRAVQVVETARLSRP